MSFYDGLRVLVTGGTGLIGRPLTELLLGAGARLRVVSLDAPGPLPAGLEFRHGDLRDPALCREVCRGIDCVFHLAGIKGSPAVAAARPASFFLPTLAVSLNMMEAARQAGVARYLYASSVGVYAPAGLLREDDVWSSHPSPRDRFAGWAKRMGELQAEACRIEHGWDRVSIVRPANVYGPYDDFRSAGAMVVPSLIRRVLAGEDPLRLWGDGSAMRDFIAARDVARGMLMAVEQGITAPLNLGSGEGTSIARLLQVVLDVTGRRPRIEWSGAGPVGDASRVMDVSRARRHGIAPRIGLVEGITETVAWYRAQGDRDDGRYRPFGTAELPVA